MILGVDGNAIDMATLGGGFICVLVCAAKRNRHNRAAFDRSKVVVDFLNGASIVPFMVMMASTFYTQLLEEVLKSKISLGIAGTVGFFFLLGEVFAPVKEEVDRSRLL